MASSGLEELDGLLGGGYPVPSAILLEGQLGVGSEKLLYRFVSNGQLRDEYCIFVTKKAVDEVLRDARAKGIKIDGKTLWIAGEGGQLKCDLKDLAGLSFSYKDLVRKSENLRIRVVFDVVSELLLLNPPDDVYRFLDQIIAATKRYEAVILAPTHHGMHAPQIMASMEQLFDGVISLEMRARRGKSLPFLRVRKMSGASVPIGASMPLTDLEVARRPARKVRKQSVLSTREVSKRRLAAIMFTDIVGFTAMGQKNESNSLRLLEEHRKLLRPIFTRWNGREIKTTGDGFLVEFPSALDAVRCGSGIQEATREFNLALTGEERIRYRVGIHLGDVVESHGDISGDAVNVASRIQPFAEDGGVCLTRQVYDQVSNKYELPLLSLGMKVLKNVKDPVEVYRVGLPWERSETRSPPLMQPEKLRVAVLPFANLSPDPKDEYFADGMTEELMTVLSSVKELSVIARTSIMQYKGVRKKASEIGRELSVGTIVEGSVRKAGDKVRLAVQLVDAQNERQIWAQSYDRKLDDIFAVQSGIAKRVARALKVRLVPGTGTTVEKKVVKSDAHILYLKGMYFRNKLNEEGWRKAVELFERAIKLEPDYADAIAALSICYDWLAYFAFEPLNKAYGRAKALAIQSLRLGDLAEAHLSMFFVSFFHEADWRKAETEMKLALRLNPSSAEARDNYAFYLANFGRTQEAIREGEMALELDPLSVMSHVVAADVHAWARKYDQAISKFDAALEISPSSSIAHNDLGMALLAMGRLEDGVRELEQADKLSERSPFFKVNLAYAYAVSGRVQEARRVATTLKLAHTKGILPAYFMAVVAAGLGDKEESLTWLEEAYKEHAIIFVPLLNVAPALESLRKEPRFNSLLSKLGLSPQKG